MPYKSKKQAVERNPSLKKYTLTEDREWGRIYDALIREGKTKEQAAAIAHARVKKMRGKK